MATAKIWRNRIEAGTQILANCPDKYRNEVILLIREDIETDKFPISGLNKLVEDGKLTPEEYDEIINA